MKLPGRGYTTIAGVVADEVTLLESSSAAQIRQLHELRAGDLASVCLWGGTSNPVLAVWGPDEGWHPVDSHILQYCNDFGTTRHLNQVS